MKQQLEWVNKAPFTVSVKTTTYSGMSLTRKCVGQKLWELIKEDNKEDLNKIISVRFMEPNHM